MPDLKLGRLPDRTPIKLSIAVLPDLHQMLIDYTAAYTEAYGKDEAVTDLIPAMLTAFLESDRSFVRARAKR